MDWDHEDTTLDGEEIFTPGTLVQANLEKAYLLVIEEPEINQENRTIKSTDGLTYPGLFVEEDEISFNINEYGKNPVVMILNLDNLENYYKISIGEKNYWCHKQYISKI